MISWRLPTGQTPVHSRRVTSPTSFSQIQDLYELSFPVTGHRICPVTEFPLFRGCCQQRRSYASFCPPPSYILLESSNLML